MGKCTFHEAKQREDGAPVQQRYAIRLMVRNRNKDNPGVPDSYHRQRTTKMRTRTSKYRVGFKA